MRRAYSEVIPEQRDSAFSTIDLALFVHRLDPAVELRLHVTWPSGWSHGGRGGASVEPAADRSADGPRARCSGRRRLPEQLCRTRNGQYELVLWLGLAR